MTLPTIGFVIGSLRKNSFNRTLANETAALLEGRADVKIIDFSDLPFLNQDEEFPTPAPVTRLREEVAACDALWVFTPEYNGTMSSQVKNFFDWMSRRPAPEAPAQPTVLTEKPATVSGASGGAATAGARGHISNLMSYIYMNVMTENQAGFVLPAEAWTEGTWTLTDADRQALETQVNAFLAFIAK